MNFRQFIAPLLLVGSFAACGGEDPLLMQSPDGKFRIVPVVDGHWEGHVDLVFAHDDAVAFAAAEASKKAGHTGIQFVGIGGLPGAQGRKYVADGVLAASIECPTGGAAAIDMALLACSGIAPPRRLLPGTRVFTKANVAAGGEAVHRPDDFVLDTLRRQHADVLTTQPKIDIVFRIGMVLSTDGDPWRAALGEELVAAAKRYPQLEIDCRTVENDAEKQRAAVRDLIAKNYHAILIAPNEPGQLAAVAKEAIAQNIKVIVIGTEPGNEDFTCFVGTDQTQLGEVAGAQIAQLLGTKGGAIVELQGPITSSIAQQRHAGFSKALGLKKP